MERFKLIADGLDTGPLLKRLLANEHLWAERTERQDYPGSAHKDTETIYLRWAVDESIEGGFYDLRTKDHVETIKALLPESYAIFNMVLARIGGSILDIGRVILTRMKPGGEIARHTDEGPYADKYDRFHVCLSGDSLFFVEGFPQAMKPGQLFWFNHKLPHWVVNRTESDRIHLIIDLVAPAYRAKRGLTFQRERPHELLDEARPLFEAHYKEIAHYQDIPLDINEALYRYWEEQNCLRVYTARYNGDLVGYVAYKVGPNARYQTSLQALQDILYVEKTKRGALFGKRLLDCSYARLKDEGVQVVYQHCKANSTTGKFFELTGHELIDLVYGKRLDR